MVLFVRYVRVWVELEYYVHVRSCYLFGILPRRGCRWAGVLHVFAAFGFELEHRLNATNSVKYVSLSKKIFLC